MLNSPSSLQKPSFMKTSLLVLPLLSLVLLALPAKAVKPVTPTITEVGITSGTTMPGSPSDYIIFNGSNFNSNGTSGGTAGSSFDLTSFSVAGGVGQNGYSAFSITPPGGGTPVLSGAIDASTPYPNPNGDGQTAQQMNAGIGLGSNSNFNYNDFDVYLMYSNTGGSLTDSVVSLDAPGQAYGTNGVAVTDNTGSPEYVEFNVQNLAASGGTYLVFSGISSSTGGSGYIGGVSFESLPEPSTFAMLLGGVALLGFIVRRKSARFTL